MQQLTIHAAQEGGYIVTTEGQPGAYNPPLYAGELTKCLEFVHRKFCPR